VRRETSPEDIHGMHAARAVVTSTGGMTSHAAVVARGMGRPCVCGATDLRVDAASQTFTVRGRTFKRGDVITVDGTTGQIMAGEAQMIQPDLSGDFSKLMSWADNVRRLKVRANAETPLDARAAREFGAEGIGLCRTEHMFFDAGRIAAVREMILSDRKEGRVAALERIAPMQRQDFVDLFSIMGEHPVTIRLLDPPLHEFLPKRVEDVEAIAVATGVDARTLLARAEDLHETNPMLGHRGCRLGITYPEIYEMQARAIFEAASLIAKETGKAPQPEIMIPLVATRREIEILKACIDEVALAVAGQTGVTIAYSVGTMIELPRAAICADEIALSAEFFSFGTNDLTQTTIGISRDDAGRFMNAYVTSGIFEKDPFVSIDVAGVGALVRLGVQKGRGARPDIKLGVCGEHGGDPASIDFFESVGLDYISCSPYRVPIARLAAAQAALRRA
jgi:pyruvate,orthophosphate dikinase